MPKISKRGGFSDRNKIKPINTEIQLKDFDKRTRIQLQNMISRFYKYVYEDEDTYYVTNITNEIVTAAFQLFKDNYKWEHPIRSLGIRASDLVLDDIPVQLDLFGNQEKKEKLEKLDRTVDEIRRRFGYFSIHRAAMYQDKVLSHLDAGTHTVHPHSYFHG